MERLKKCRICLEDNIPLRVIADTHLKEIYESLTSMPFETEDSRPTLACYICCARLQNCYQLRINCLHSETLFTQMLNNNMIEQESPSKNSIRIVHPVVQLNIIDKLRRISDCNEKASKVLDDEQVKEKDQQVLEFEIEVKQEEVTVKEEYIGETEESDLDENRSDVGVGMKYSQTKDSPGVVKVEQDDYETEFNNDSTEKYRKELSDTIQLLKTDPTTSAHISKETRQAKQSNPEDSTSNDPREKTDAKVKKVKNSNCEINVKIETATEYDICYDGLFVSNIRKNQHISTDIDKSQTQSVNKDSLHQSANNSSNNKTKACKCDICQKSFRNNFDLKLHLRTHTGEKPYQCNICKTRFRTKHNLKTHNRIYTSDKLYQCNICDKYFCVKGSLTSHMYIHTGQRLYECTECKKSFNKKSNFNTHMQTHTGEKPFQCTICKRCFNQQRYLNKHNRIHHGGKSC